MSVFNLRPYTINVAAGGEQDFNVTGDLIMVIESTGELEVSFDGGAFTYITAGLAYPMRALETYSRITLRNKTGSVITGRVMLGMGKDARDSRLSLTGSITVGSITDDVSVVNGASSFVVDTGADIVAGATNALRVHDGYSLANNALLSGSNEGALVQGFTDLTGASYYYAYGVVASGTDIVAAIDNTDGILVFRAEINPDTAGPCQLLIDGDQIAVADGYYSGGNSSTRGSILERYKIPAGKALEYYSAATTAQCCVIYKLL